MAANSSSVGLTPASESLVALTKIMNRIVVSLRFTSLASEGPESLALPSRRMAPAGIDMPDDFFWREGKKMAALIVSKVGLIFRGRLFAQKLVILHRSNWLRFAKPDILVQL